LQEELSHELGICESRFAPGACNLPEKKLSGGSEELTNTFFEGLHLLLRMENVAQ
jgi:hypothetical protein